jgi:hypothetical protein
MFILMTTSIPFTADSGALTVTPDLSARAVPDKSKINAISNKRILFVFFMIFSF